MEYKRVKCPKCGAMKEQAAEKKCRPVRDYTDEYTCPSENFLVDRRGFFILEKLAK
jgi:predicted RNA-binding Zn-ribbon protein involved in translation (DUF1610 family)